MEIHRAGAVEIVVVLCALTVAVVESQTLANRDPDVDATLVVHIVVVDLANGGKGLEFLEFART